VGHTTGEGWHTWARVPKDDTRTSPRFIKKNKGRRREIGVSLGGIWTNTSRVGQLLFYEHVDHDREKGAESF